MECGFITCTNISIHAPAKGATILLRNQKQVFEISIHAPAKGATLFVPIVYSWLRNFNPRSREGSDKKFSSGYTPAQIFQSTLPRRERLRSSSSLSFFGNFNPRSREGSDDGYNNAKVKTYEFQSTLPRRERRRV